MSEDILAVLELRIKNAKKNARKYATAKNAEMKLSWRII